MAKTWLHKVLCSLAATAADADATALCCQGANAPLSGLLALLAALHQLKATAAATAGAAGSGGQPLFSSYSKRLVFLALAGEPWGYMGSRRLLYEAASGSNATAGLDLSLVEAVSG